MNTRNLVAIASLALLGAAPLTARAHGSDKATDACIQKFVDTYLPKDRTVNVQKPSASSPLSVYATRYTIDLVARAGRNGEELVSARCVASTSGRVLSLKGPSPG